MAQPDLQTRFCRRYRCTPAEFIEQAFYRCLYPHGRVLAPIIRRMAPHYFARDLQLIKYVGLATDLAEVQTEVATFQDANRWQPAFGRNRLRIRVSGRRVMSLCRQLLAE